MSKRTDFFSSTVGRKVLMAVTGVIMAGWLLGHLAGNLQVFGPPEMINHYAHFLKTTPSLLWGTRVLLFVAVLVHIFAAMELAAANKAARPVGYASPKPYGAAWQSRYMLLTGLVIAAFVVYHLAHFTVLIPQVNGLGDFRNLTAIVDGESVPDVYAMMILGFQVWWVALFYLIAQALLFVHLSHGLSSLFQSLGLRDHNWWPRIRRVAQVTSLAIFVAFSAIPISITLKLVGADYAEGKRAEVAQGVR